MFRKSILVPVLAGTLFLGGCYGGNDHATMPPSAQEAGALTVEADISASTPFMKSEAYANAAVKRVGEAVQKQRLGDRFRVVPIGSRSVDNAVDAFSMASSQKVHLRTVRTHLEGALRDLFAQARSTGGDGNTNIVYTITNSHPVCNPGSAIYILSDGVESTAELDVGKALAAGQPIELPKPSEALFRGGCSIWFIGIGASSSVSGGEEVQALPDDQLQALTGAWERWFVAAGAAPDKVHFETIL